MKKYEIKIIDKNIGKYINELMDIWLSSNIDAHSFIEERYWVSNYNMVKDMLPKADIYTYTLENKIIGFIGVVNSNYIAGLFVNKDYRSKGVGKKLLDYCKNIYETLELDVYEKNTKAVSFYEKNEFVVGSKNIDDNLSEEEYHMVWIK